MSRLAILLAAVVAGCGRPRVSSVEWLAMGTVAKVSFKCGGCDASAQRNAGAIAREAYARVEDRLSVRNPKSEISNYTSVEAVSPDMRPCYEMAFDVQRKSGGAFNPFWRGNGKGPDLGGIAKGFAVDMAAKRLESAGIGREGDVLLDLGGNLKVVSGVWRTGIRDPSGSGGIVQTLTLSNGMACATSGEYERGKHISDGRTGIPVSNDVASVTVVHPSSATVADALSTVLFVLGRADGDDFLKRHYPDAFAVWVMRDANGRAHTRNALRR